MGMNWTKPPIGTPIDWSNALTNVLVAAYACNEGAGLTLLDSAGMQDSVIDPGQATWPGLNQGVSFENTGPSTYIKQAAATFPRRAAFSEMTVMTDFSDSRTDNFGAAFSLSGPGDLLGVKWAGSTTMALTTAFPATSVSIAAAQQTRRTYAFLAGMSSFEIWWDGQQRATAAGTGTGLYSGYFPSLLTIGGHANGYLGRPHVNWFFAWGRILLDAEIRSITSDPFQIFQSASPWYLIEHSLASGPTSATLTGPTSGVLGAKSTAFTVTLDQPAGVGGVIITPTSTGGGDTFTLS